MKCSKAFLLSALQPPATYIVLALAGHYSSSLPATSLLVVLSLPPLLWFWNRASDRLYGTTPAYASVVGHCGSAVVTFVIKLLPFAGIGLGTLFFMASCAFGVVFTRMIGSDPGRMDDYALEQQEHAVEDCISSDTSLMTDVQWRRQRDLRAYDNFLRGKFCRYCASFIERYDHHCAAIQNCIGLKNTGTFLLLLTITCTMEILYLECCYIYFKRGTPLSTKNHLRGFLLFHYSIDMITDGDVAASKNLLGLAWELLRKEAWVLSLAVFVGLQISWQVPFLMFQVYLIGINLTTDEWVNWQEIPRFHRQMITRSEPPLEVMFYIRRGTKISFTSLQDQTKKDLANYFIKRLNNFYGELIITAFGQ
ncbi:hypothetical protein GOP47_0002085 [Adiantum capillus-veneris]|uniref:S-acyltransferase n=1 Tax=Adiantum capillus-veneris TaxID=13818 RepID=A0A9D4ZQW0_ADICA|nr:hypothetical protein GOP47_0002085 [Adiantum capillus-veneris]